MGPPYQVEGEAPSPIRSSDVLSFVSEDAVDDKLGAPFLLLRHGVWRARRRLGRPAVSMRLSLLLLLSWLLLLLRLLPALLSLLLPLLALLLLLL